MAYDNALKRVNLEVLSVYLEDERGHDGLRPIPHNFNELFVAYYEKINRDFMEATSFDERCMLEDERRSAKILYEALVDKRLGKIIGYALLNVRPLNAMPSELECYESLHSTLSGYKDVTLDVVRRF